IRRIDRKIKIIFDMVDAYFIRLDRQYQLTGDQNVGRESRRYEKLELDLARAADQVWCNSSEDKKLVSQHVPGERIVVIPTIHELQDRGKPFAERNGLLFVGHLSHSPNSDAVNYFMHEISPLIKNSLSSVVFNVVGSNAPPEIRAYDSDSVKILGHVPDIKPLLQTARVFVAPLRFGAGVKGKIGESLSFGLPVVTTSIGAEGFGLTSGENVMIADTPTEFAANVSRLYHDSALWQRLADQGYRHIEEHFTPQVIAKTIETGLEDLDVINRKTD
ncbi:MAG TPA: glycosyltransferase family 4 protein, partial [Pyrinomonadaceae bacterium]|nr:glycosyltransferase family 4 protein [Pyrinomonadaceae bacterium]